MLAARKVYFLGGGILLLPFLFFLTPNLVCFSCPIHFPPLLPPIPPSLRGSSVWLFIGNDSHCGRAPLRLRSPHPNRHHLASPPSPRSLHHPHPSPPLLSRPHRITPPPSVPSAMHYSWSHNQMRELRLVAGDVVHGSSSPKVP